MKRLSDKKGCDKIVYTVIVTKHCGPFVSLGNCDSTSRRFVFADMCRATKGLIIHFLMTAQEFVVPMGLWETSVIRNLTN